MHQLRIYIMGSENLIIINNQNSKILLVVKEIFQEVFHDYCMVHLFENFTIDARDKEFGKMF